MHNQTHTTLVATCPTAALPTRSRAEELSRGLYPHQVEGLAFLLGRSGAILADDMGLGKTRQAILALKEAAPAGPWLVVCPASVKLNWAREIAIALPESRTQIIGDPPAAGYSGWVIVNYDILDKHIHALIKCRFQGVIFDEAHYLKNHTSRRSKLGRQLLDQTSPRPVTYLLTGTPLTNRPRDLFVLLQLIQHPLGRSFLSFAKRYCSAQHNGYGWVTNGASNIPELTVQLHGVMIRRKKEDVLCLPPKVRTFFDVEVPEGTAAAETRQVLEILLDPKTRTRSPRNSRANLIATLTKLRHSLAKAKVKATIDFVEGTIAQGEKVIVFSSFDEPIRRIAEKFGDKAVLLTGKIPSRKRQELVDRFQNDDSIRLFAANLVAGGVGLNLTAARLVVFNDLDWVPANHWHAEDRAYRIGQTGSVHVAYIVAAETVDRFVQTVIETKTRLFDAVIDGQSIGDAATRDVLSELEALMAHISPGIADETLDLRNPQGLRAFLGKAAEAFRAANPDSAEAASSGNGSVRADLLDLLARALGGPTRTIYRCASSSKPGSHYSLLVDGGDVTCTCPGFEYRGMCRHSRELKASLALTGGAPKGYELTQG